MATKKAKVKDEDPNKEIGYFTWHGDDTISGIDTDGGLSLEYDTLEAAKGGAECNYDWDNDDDVVYIYRVTVERVLKATKPSLVFEKV